LERARQHSADISYCAERWTSIAPKPPSLPSTDQRYIRKLQIRAGKWKPTGIKPYVVTTLYGMAQRDLPARAMLQRRRETRTFSETFEEKNVDMCFSFSQRDTALTTH